MKNLFNILAILFLLIGFGLMNGCSKDQGAAPTPTPDPEVSTDNVTYENFVGALLQNKCSACHSAGGEGASQWTFAGYGSVKANGEQINEAVLVTGVMPKVGSLSPQEKALLKAWFERNMPEK